MQCGTEELDIFIDGSRKIADGWIGFYWGKTLDECRRSRELRDALMVGWLEFFQKRAKGLAFPGRVRP